MERKYTLSLGLNHPINIDALEPYIHSLDLFVPEETFRAAGSSKLFAKTKTGGYIQFEERLFTFSPDKFLDETAAVKLTLELAIKLQSHKLSFNPNLLDLDIGGFDGEESFKRDFGPTAQSLQRSLYLGGSVWYFENSNDFRLLLGTEEEMSRYIKRTRYRGRTKLEFEGAAHPAASLDELLARIIQD